MEFGHPVELTNIEVSLKLFNRDVISGKLCLSKHYIMIMNSNNSQNDILILHKSIDNVKFLSESILEVKTKDFKVYQLEIHTLNLKEVMQLHSNIIRASNEENINELFPFIFKPTFKIIENGWTAFLLKEEFTEVLMSGLWNLISGDECSSYDKTVIVPAKTTTDDVMVSARLHVNNRFPVLSFFYRQVQSSLLRCSQYFPNIDRTPTNDPVIKLLDYSHSFIDIRSRTTIKNYPLEARVVHNGVLGMDKIDNLQMCFQKFIEAIQDSSANMDNYFKKLDGSQWLDRVRHMMISARFIAHSMLSKKDNYIIIGDTGFDFELVMTSLVQVILHSDARTIRGFEALIDREWIQAGHPFYDRCKHQVLSNKTVTADSSTDGESPVFLLFLDCVWQIMQFNPTSFEFNELFLQCLAHHAYFSSYGTFLGNNARHREELNIPSDTTSLWSYINQNEIMNLFLNCLYDPAGRDTGNYVCWPPVLPQHIQVWQELYCGQSISSIEVKRKTQKKIVEEYNSSRIINSKLRKLIETLQELSESNDVSP